jgi:hypothetical protein
MRQIPNPFNEKPAHIQPPSYRMCRSRPDQVTRTLAPANTAIPMSELFPPDSRMVASLDRKRLGQDMAGWQEADRRRFWSAPAWKEPRKGARFRPLLSSLVLDELDRELERRGHRFVRYADDCNIYVRSARAGQRVMESITGFFTDKLKLKVNESKELGGTTAGAEVRQRPATVAARQACPRLAPGWQQPSRRCCRRPLRRSSPPAAGARRR